MLRLKLVAQPFFEQLGREQSSALRFLRELIRQYDLYGCHSDAV